LVLNRKVIFVEIKHELKYQENRYVLIVVADTGLKHRSYLLLSLLIQSNLMCTYKLLLNT